MFFSYNEYFFYKKNGTSYNYKIVGFLTWYMELIISNNKIEFG